MASLPAVAVVILNWNGKSFLEKFLPSVTKSVYGNLKLYVADNASTDGSVIFLQTFYPEINIIVNPDNEGFAKGYNTALKQVSADYYVLLNTDVEVTPAWIEPVIDLMKSNEIIAACQPKVLSYSNKKCFEYAGASGGFIDKFGYPFARGRIFETCEEDVGQYDAAVPVFWATGAAFFIRASVFHEMNGFDEYFFAHQEEIDLCWRIQSNGYSIHAVPASVVYHVGGGTLAMGSRRKVLLNFRNNLVMMSKNLPFKELVWKIPLRISLDAIAAYRYLIHGDFSTFISIASAHLQYVQWFFFKRKQKNLRKIKMKSLRGVYDASVAWQYFIKKKKKYSEIIDYKK